MSEHSVPVAVVMERLRLNNPWCLEKWQVQGVVRDIFGPEARPRVIFKNSDCLHVLFPGLTLSLRRDETEGYYLNVSSPEPRVFVMWRTEEVGPTPTLVTVSYNEAARWMDASETVDGVPMPPEFFAWVGDYVERHYHPEPKKVRRRT